jgi:hypothetical protein
VTGEAGALAFAATLIPAAMPLPDAQILRAPTVSKRAEAREGTGLKTMTAHNLEHVINISKFNMVNANLLDIGSVD